MKKRSFRSTFVSVILVITVAISIVNLAVYGINIKKIRQVEVLKMKTAGERIDDMITISLNNIKGLKQICCTDNYARNILLKNNEKNDIGTKFENQNYMDNALKHIASMDTLILRATIVNKYGNIYCTDTSIPEEYVKTIRNMTKEWMLFEGKEDEYYYGGLQGDNANILTFLYPLHTYGNILQDKKMNAECIPGCRMLSEEECKIWQVEQDDSDEEIDEQWLETITREDTVVCVLGEHESQSGEAASRAFLTLPEEQQMLFEKIAKRTDNIVTVVISGRPLDLRRISEKLVVVYK